MDFYRAADVFVYPSHNETFGLTILEAMACGCPVVTSDRSAMPETAGGARPFWRIPTTRSRSPARILTACEDGARLRGPGIARAAEFTWAQTAKETLEVYREVHANRRSRR